MPITAIVVTRGATVAAVNPNRLILRPGYPTGVIATINNGGNSTPTTTGSSRPTSGQVWPRGNR